MILEKLKKRTNNANDNAIKRGEVWIAELAGGGRKRTTGYAPSSNNAK